MARGRIIDREIFSHEVLGFMPMEVRQFYHGLIVFADDEGRLKADPRYLKAKIFPYDNIKETHIQNMVDQLATNGFLVVYTVKTSTFLAHPKWDKWQPIRKDRFKPSDCPSPVDGQPVVNQMSTVGIPLPNLTKPNLTKPNLTKPNLTCDGFQDFWKVYPKRIGKGVAEKAWYKLEMTQQLKDQILKAVENQILSDQWTKDGGQYIPHPSTWLNQKRWEDEIQVEKKEFVA